MSTNIDEFFVAVSRHEAMARIGLPTTPPLLNGRYELHAVLGSGSFGVVYRAWDPVLEMWVAIKRTAEGGLVEARALASVHHSNVVRVFDVVQDASTMMMVIEYLDGVTLADWVRGGEVDASELVDLLAKAADGLAAIHSAGLVHADIKPSNVMVIDREPVIVDLGLAMARSGGAPKYMAPEVRRGGAPDAASDQYSFCLVAREALGARAGWRCKRVLRRGLSYVPADRWPTTSELARALRQCAWWRRCWWLRWLLLVAMCSPRTWAALPDRCGTTTAPPASGRASGPPCVLPLASATV